MSSSPKLRLFREKMFGCKELGHLSESIWPPGIGAKI